MFKDIIVIKYILYILSEIKTPKSKFVENELKVIGAGGFGIVYENKMGNVLKAIINKTSCNEGEKQFEKQKL